MSVETKFEQYLNTLEDKTAAAILKAAVEKMSFPKRREFIINHCPAAAAPEANTCNNSACGFDMGPGYENCGGCEDGVCPECGTDNSPERQWNVPILRTSYSHTMMAVSARNKEEAIAKAIDEAGDVSFSENSSNYEAPDGAMEILDSNK